MWSWSVVDFHRGSWFGSDWCSHGWGGVKIGYVGYVCIFFLLLCGYYLIVRFLCSKFKF